MSLLGILHVGVLIDDCHHLRDRLRVAFKHLEPKLDVVQALVEVVDYVPVINLRNCIMVSKVPLVAVTEGLVGLLGDTAQIPSGFGTRTGCLKVVDECGAEVLSAVD
jgi:hypothetical protein